MNRSLSRSVLMASAAALAFGLSGCGVRGPLELPPSARAADPAPGGEPAPPPPPPAAQRSVPPIDWLVR